MGAGVWSGVMRALRGVAERKSVRTQGDGRLCFMPEGRCSLLVHPRMQRSYIRGRIG